MRFFRCKRTAPIICLCNYAHVPQEKGTSHSAPLITTVFSSTVSISLSCSSHPVGKTVTCREWATRISAPMLSLWLHICMCVCVCVQKDLRGVRKERGIQERKSPPTYVECFMRLSTGDRTDYERRSLFDPEGESRSRQGKTPSRNKYVTPRTSYTWYDANVYLRMTTNTKSRPVPSRTGNESN